MSGRWTMRGVKNADPPGAFAIEHDGLLRATIAGDAWGKVVYSYWQSVAEEGEFFGDLYLLGVVAGVKAALPPARAAGSARLRRVLTDHG